MPKTTASAASGAMSAATLTRPARRPSKVSRAVVASLAATALPAAPTGRQMPVEQQRALEVMDAVPAGHTALFVRDDAFEPHLRLGEFAIVDTTDTEPVVGEIFVIVYGAAKRRCLCVPAKGIANFVGDPGPSEVFYVHHDIFPRPPREEKLTRDEVNAALNSRRMRVSEGSFRPSYPREKLLGRVVGVLASTGGLE